MITEAMEHVTHIEEPSLDEIFETEQETLEYCGKVAGC